MTIDYLANHPDLIAPLARQCAGEWAHLYLAWGEGEAVEEFRLARTDADSPPPSSRWTRTARCWGR